MKPRKEIRITYQYKGVDQTVHLLFEVGSNGLCTLKFNLTIMEDMIKLAKDRGMNIEMVDVAESIDPRCGKLKADCDEEFCPIHGRDIR